MSTDARKGFLLIELLVVIALLVSILLPALASARRAARIAMCQRNLHQLGVATNTYGNDYKERIFAFSWLAGDALSSDNGLNYDTHDFNAVCNQMVDIVRRRGDRTVSEVPSGGRAWIQTMVSVAAFRRIPSRGSY